MIRLTLCVSALIFCVFAGCGGGHQFKFDAQKVEGTVLYKGAPLSQATVSFAPKIDDDGSKFASGKTDENGKFTLTIRPGGEPGKGTTPGDYLVLVSRKGDKPVRYEKSDMGDVPIYEETVPKKYQSKLHTDLSAFVEKKPKNEFVFELKDK